MSEETAQDRLLWAINDCQQKLDRLIYEEASPAMIVAARAAVNVGLGRYQQDYGALPVYRQLTGKWDK